MGIVYRLCEGLLARLPVDESGGRVFRETLADWRREPGIVRGLASVSRAVAGVVTREIVSPSMSLTWLRVAGWSTAWALLGFGLSSLTLGRVGPRGSVLAWAVTSTVFFLPAAILLSAGNQRRQVPVLGLSLTAAVVGALLVGWLLPFASRIVFGPLVDMPFIEPVVSGARPEFLAVWPPLSVDYMNGRYAHDLPRLVANGPPGGWRGIQLISFNMAFVCLCALTPLIASRLSRLQLWTRRSGVGVTLMMLLYRVRIESVVAPDWILWGFVAPWLPVVVLAAVLIARSHSGGPDQPPPRLRRSAEASAKAEGHALR